MSCRPADQGNSAAKAIVGPGSTPDDYIRFGTGIASLMFDVSTSVGTKSALSCHGSGRSVLGLARCGSATGSVNSRSCELAWRDTQTLRF